MPSTNDMPSARSEGGLGALSLVAEAKLPRSSLHSRQLMLRISYLIEDIAGSIPGTALIAAFQRWSLVRPQIRRYSRIAPLLSGTYVLGFADIPEPAIPNTHVLSIPSDALLLHEWVVIAAGPACCLGLFARDEEMLQPAQTTRRFQGGWSSEPAHIEGARAAFYRALQLPCPTITYGQATIQETARRFRTAFSQRSD